MSARLRAQGSWFDGQPPIWSVVALAVAPLFLISFWSQWRQGIWDEEAYAHLPLVGIIAAWLFWRAPLPKRAGPVHVVSWSSGLALMLFGGLGYWTGYAAALPAMYQACLILIVAGTLLVVGGRVALAAWWFPTFFLVFLIPLPGFVIDHLTAMLKWRISWLTEIMLFHLGYPVARDGVTLVIGQYHLLVADACSGLNSLFSLSAMGLLYIHLMGYSSRLKVGLLVLLILPIAVLANLIRVVLLVLITYYFGDDVAQSMLHGAAGIFLFALALMLLFGTDHLIQRVPMMSAAQRA